MNLGAIALTRWLQNFAGKIRQPGAFAARQGNVPTVLPAFELVNGKGQARRALGQVRRVNLG